MLYIAITSKTHHKYQITHHMNIQEISDLLDSKLEPIKNDIAAIRTDVSAVKAHVGAINERLYKLEDRLSRMDTKFDSIIRRVEVLENA